MNDQVFAKVLLAVRAALAASLSLVVGRLIHLHEPIYALLAAIIVTDTSAARTRSLGLRRLGATAIGTVCGGLMSMLLPHSPWTVGAGTLVAMLACIFINAPEAARVAGYVAGIILLGHRGDPWPYSLGRFLETALGVLVAWGISVMPKLIGADGPEA